MLRFFTAGETHGKCLTVIIEGMPAGVKIDLDKINAALAARQQGYGRGGRMKIETDRAEILSGVRGGYTLGSPIAMKIENKDWANWQEIMGTEYSNGEPIVVRAAMKPIPTQYNPLRTVNIEDKTEHKASVERSDICAVPACAVVVQAAVEFELTKAFLEKFSGDCMDDIKAYYDIYIDRIGKF